MKIRKLLAGFFAASLLLTTACKDDEIFENDIVKGAYQGGILLGVEGGFNKNQAEVSYLSSDLSTLSENIYLMIPHILNLLLSLIHLFLQMVFYDFFLLLYT